MEDMSIRKETNHFIQNIKIKGCYVQLERLRSQEKNDVKNKLVCQYCSKSFKWRSKLKEHLNYHRGYKPYSCTVCTKKFVAKGEFNRHIQIHESNRERRHGCSVCGKKFVTKGGLTVHIQIHESNRERRHGCSVCGKKFVTKGELTVHIPTHESNRERMHGCNVCGKSFYTNAALKLHYNIHTQSKQYSCHLCPRVFNQSSNLQEHINGVGLHKGLCKMHFTKKSVLKVHILHVHGERKASCSICKKEVKHEKQHIAYVHSNDKKMITCPQCPITFRKKSTMQRHAESVHLGLTRYCCDVCGHKFYYKGALVVHMRRHNWVKPFHCTMCSKKFVSNSELSRHSVSHSDERNYSCIYCCKKFNHKSYMKKHIRKVHLI